MPRAKHMDSRVVPHTLVSDISQVCGYIHYGPSKSVVAMFQELFADWLLKNSFRLHPLMVISLHLLVGLW